MSKQNKEPISNPSTPAVGTIAARAQYEPSNTGELQKAGTETSDTAQPVIRAGFSASMIEGTTRIGRCSKCNK